MRGQPLGSFAGSAYEAAPGEPGAADACWPPRLIVARLSSEHLTNRRRLRRIARCAPQLHLQARFELSP